MGVKPPSFPPLLTRMTITATTIIATTTIDLRMIGLGDQTGDDQAKQ